MKIRITENQLQRVINEVGGYDDTEIMGLHASNVHAPLLQTLGTTIGLLNTLITNYESGEVTKENLNNFISNLTDKLDVDIDLINRLGGEIFVDKDFRQLMREYKVALKKLQKRLRILYSGEFGLTFGMSKDEIYRELVGEIGKLENYVTALSGMFKTVHDRFRSRLGFN